MSRKSFCSLGSRSAPAIRCGASENEKGFTLIEVIISFVIIMVAMLGVVQALTFAITYNYGNKARGQALAVMQQEVELLRSKKFTPAFTDTALAAGTTTKIVNTESGAVFQVQTVIDNEPMVDGVQNDAYQCLSPQGVVIPCAFKEITISVRQETAPTAWQAAVAVRTVLRRTRGN
ncbi:MAG: hypothetical protein DMF63_01050 [Acidobacteria bacterium]|nr:MAG: hypothetical protein DMF63_01050 [Acidobacteriota bacterium]